MKIVADSANLGMLALKLNDINLQDKVTFEFLIEIISKNKQLTDISLESCALLVPQLTLVLETCYTNNRSLKWLNLAYNPIKHKPEEPVELLLTILCEVISFGPL
jgi:hypothetical protein